MCGLQHNPTSTSSIDLAIDSYFMCYVPPDYLIFPRYRFLHSPSGAAHILLAEWQSSSRTTIIPHASVSRVVRHKLCTYVSSRIPTFTLSTPHTALFYQCIAAMRVSTRLCSTRRFPLFAPSHISQWFLFYHLCSSGVVGCISAPCFVIALSLKLTLC